MSPIIRHLRKLLGTVAAAAACLSASQAHAASEYPWPVLHSSSHAQCPWHLTDGPAAHVLGSRWQWEELMSTSEKRALGRRVDWRHQQVIVFGMDVQRSLGYKVEVDTPTVWVHGKVAYLDVRLTAPQPGQAAAAALSQPCVLAVVNRRPWRSLEVRDVHAHERALWRGHVKPRI